MDMKVECKILKRGSKAGLNNPELYSVIAAIRYKDKTRPTFDFPDAN